MAHYRLRDNPLTEDPNDKLAQLEGVKSFTKDEIIERILNRGNTMTRTDLLAAINAYAEEIVFITEEGNTVNTPLFNTSLSISGVFTNGDDTFDPRRHTLKVKVTAGTTLKEAASKIKLVKVQGSSTVPWVTGIRDTLSTTDDASSFLKAGSVIELTGTRLKFDATDAEQGVFFLSNNTETRLTQIIEDKPTRVLAVLPITLAAGDYTIEVRSRYSGASGKETKALKKGSFEKLVTVTA